MGHVGHDDVGGGACIQAHAQQGHDMHVVKVLHLQTLLQYLVHLHLVKLACIGNSESINIQSYMEIVYNYICNFDGMSINICH